MIVVTVENAESLYQYDMNRLIIISGLDPGPTYEIHFTNNNMNYVICKETTVDESGNIIAKIPNSLLQTTQPITLYVYGITDNVSKTYYKSWLEIKPRPKPDGYVLPDDEDDVARYSKLEKQIEDTRGDVYDLSEFVHSDIDTRLGDIESAFADVGNVQNELITEVAQARTDCEERFNNLFARADGTDVTITELEMKHDKKIGDIESALDGIIAIQNGLLGVSE